MIAFIATTCRRNNLGPALMKDLADQPKTAQGGVSCVYIWDMSWSCPHAKCNRPTRTTRRFQSPQGRALTRSHCITLGCALNGTGWTWHVQDMIPNPPAHHALFDFRADTRQLGPVQAHTKHPRNERLNTHNHARHRAAAYTHERGCMNTAHPAVCTAHICSHHPVTARGSGQNQHSH